MKTTITWILATLAICLPVSAEVTEQTFQDTAFTVMKSIVISTGASDNENEVQQIASEFLKDITGGKGLKLTDQEKREIAKEGYAVSFYEDVLENYAELEKQGGKRMGIFNDYAKKADLSELEKLVMVKLLLPLEGRLDNMRITLNLNKAKMAWFKYMSYEQKHGKAPTSIKELKLEESEQFVDSKTGKIMDWKVLPADKQFGTPKRKAVFMAPVAIAGKRVVAVADGGVLAIDEKNVPEKLR